MIGGDDGASPICTQFRIVILSCSALVTRDCQTKIAAPLLLIFL